MNFKTLNRLGVVILFIGLMAIYSGHIAHYTREGIELKDVLIEHVLIGLPITLAGIFCLLKAERMPEQVVKDRTKAL